MQSEHPAIVASSGAPLIAARVLSGAFGAECARFARATQAAHEIVTSAPALVMQFAKGTNTDGHLGDPTALVVPPTEQYGYHAHFVTLDRFDFVTLGDGTVSPPAKFAPGSTEITGIHAPIGGARRGPRPAPVGA